MEQRSDRILSNETTTAVSFSATTLDSPATNAPEPKTTVTQPLQCASSMCLAAAAAAPWAAVVWRLLSQRLLVAPWASKLLRLARAAAALVASPACRLLRLSLRLAREAAPGRIPPPPPQSSNYEALLAIQCWSSQRSWTGRPPSGQHHHSRLSPSSCTTPCASRPQRQLASYEPSSTCLWFATLASLAS